MTTKIYLLANMTPIYNLKDNTQDFIHLTCTVCYTDKDKIYNLLNYNEPCFIFRILSRPDAFHDITIHSKYLIEFKCSLNYFLPYDNFKDTLLSKILEKNPNNINDPINTNILNNVIFIFENSDWITIQRLFKLIKINLSGGSITKRHFLSTTDFQLTKFLYLMGYQKNEIYENHKNLSTSFKFTLDLYPDNIEIFKQIILKEDILALDKLISEKKTIDLKVNTTKGNIDELKSKLNNKTQNSTKIKSLQKSIKDLQDKIKIFKNDILSIEILENELRKKIEIYSKNNDSTLSDSAIINEYFKKYHINNINLGKSALDSVVSQFREILKKK